MRTQNNSGTRKSQLAVAGIGALVLLGMFSTGFVNKAFAATPDSSTTQCTMVSDTTTLSNTGHGSGHLPAILASYISPDWTAIINGASWIWGAATTSNHDASKGGSQNFDKKFKLTAVPASATLTIAADNDYAVWVNGTMIASTTNGDNFTSATEVSVPASDLKQGYNDMKIEVVNLGQTNGNPESNPAGLLYSLSISGASCKVGSTTHPR